MRQGGKTLCRSNADIARQSCSRHSRHQGNHHHSLYSLNVQTEKRRQAVDSAVKQIKHSEMADVIRAAAVVLDQKAQPHPDYAAAYKLLKVRNE